MVAGIFAIIALISTLTIVFTPLYFRREEFNIPISKWIWLFILSLAMLHHSELRGVAYNIFCYTMMLTAAASWFVLSIGLIVLCLGAPYALFIMMHNLIRRKHPWGNYSIRRGWYIVFASILASGSFILIYDAAIKTGIVQF